MPATFKPFRVYTARHANPIAVAIRNILFCSTVIVGAPIFSATIAHAQSTSEQQQYDIPAGPLDQVLNRFATAANVLLSVDARLTTGKSSGGVAGRHTASEALQLLLAGTGLEAVPTSQGGYKLQPATDAVTLAAVKVSETATGLDDDGRAADGYHAKTVSSVGPLDSMALLDTPFSISIVPNELMQNIQAASSDDIYRINPYTKISQPLMAGFIVDTIIRGFYNGDTAEDGLRRHRNHESTMLEDKERIEILSGLSGFLYGAANPGGIVNYVYKRPTLARLNSVTVGNYGGAQYFVHGDFGGRIDEAGRFGYRINAVARDGETVVDDQDVKRQLFSAAFDWQATENLLLELSAAYGTLEIDGGTPFWYFAGGVKHPSAPDVDRQWNQPWAHNEFKHKKLSPRFNWQINDHVVLRGAYGWNKVVKGDGDGYIDVYNYVTSPTTYIADSYGFGIYEYVSKAGSLLADISFTTGPLEHKVTTGYYVSEGKDRGDDYFASSQLGPLPLSSPMHVERPEFPANDTDISLSARKVNENYVLGDHITLNDQWSALIGINHSRIIAMQYSPNGSHSQPAYDDSRNSPAISLIYKPLPWITTYASHLEGLQQGGTAPDTANNRKEMMAPMVSRQQEIGVKAEVGGVLLTGALFRIEKALEFTDPADNFFKQSGRQNHKGLELTATGRATSQLTVVSGLTFLDAQMKHQIDDRLEGNTPIDVAERMAKLYMEYDTGIVSGLTLTGGVFYTGKQYVDSYNTESIPSYTTLDAGARYAMQVGEKPLTLRLNATNITGKDYWLNSNFLGAPRSVALSAEMKF